jgi:hypothetical protein
MPPTRTAPATRKRSAGGFLFGLFTGVVIGLAVSLGIAFYLNRSPVPLLAAKAKPAEKETGKPPAIAGLPQTASAPTTAPDKPKFDFYKILPGSEEPVTDRELRERLRASRSSASSRPSSRRTCPTRAPGIACAWGRTRSSRRSTASASRWRRTASMRAW